MCEFLRELFYPKDWCLCQAFFGGLCLAFRTQPGVSNIQ